MIPSLSRAMPVTVAAATRPTPPSTSHSEDAVGQDTLSKIPDWTLKYFSKGNRVKPLFNKEAAPDANHEIFAQVEKTIKSAKSSIQIEMFNIDKTAIVDLLIAEARTGRIKVQVIMDPPSHDWDEPRKKAIEKLRQGGVDVMLYPVKQKGDPQAKFGQLDHVKMLLVDGTRAIIGGMNWGAHSPMNHDYDVAIEGPAVEKMSWLFREDWIKSGGDGHALPHIPQVAPTGSDMVNLLVSGLADTESAHGATNTIGKTVRRAIENAKKSVHAELFVLTDSKTVEALIEARKKGRDVKVILNPLKIDGKAINEKAAAQLRAAGVEVRWFDCNAKTGQKLHAKMAVFDDDQVVVGSANWSYAGFNVNREADVEVLSKGTASAFDKVFDKDWKHRTTEDPVYIDAPEDAGG